MSPTRDRGKTIDSTRGKTRELAEKYVKKGKLTEAISEYKKLLRGDTQEVNVRNIISNLYLKMNQKRKALDELARVAGHYEERGLYSQAMAVYKKINKLNPKDTETAMKLGDLYVRQGFPSEAKAEYVKAGKDLMRDNQTKKAIFLYEKLKKLDKKDPEARLALADLYAREGSPDQAVDELNEAAKIKISGNDLKQARELLYRARKLKADHPRTLSNLVDLLKRVDEKKEAISLIDDILEKDKDNVKALRQLGNLYFDDQNLEKAEEIFSKIISLQPKDVRATVKLGQINILRNNLDQAFELYEPMVDNFIQQQNVEKAIGLLGLIISSKKAHVPTLEGLASIYKSNNQTKNLEIVYRVILEEYHKKDLKKESLPILSELARLCPKDDEISDEYNRLLKKFGSPEIEKVADVPLEKAKEVEAPLPEQREEEEPLVEPKEAEAQMEKTPEIESAVGDESELEVPLDEAKREVEETVAEPKEAEVSFEKTAEVEPPMAEEIEPELPPEEPKEAEVPLDKEGEAEQPLPGPKEAEAATGEEKEQELQLEKRREAEGPPQVEKEAEETKIPVSEEKEPEVPLEATKEAEPPAVEKKEVGELSMGQKIAERILEREKEAELSLKEKKEADVRLDLLEGTEQKLEMSLAQADLYVEQGLLRNARRILENLRISYPDDPRISQKLDTISKASPQAKVDEILQRVEKVSAEETKLFGKKAYFRFNLGIAFLEQGLLDEAIEEFKLASKDKSRTVECYTIISNCYRQKKDSKEAVKWLEKALKITEEGTDWFYALKYELGSIYEELKETEKAFVIYSEIKNWNPEYKDVDEKIKVIEKKLQK
ncbi:MAG: tetratricopeptide repeat protein [Candidatus Aminicenantes bacterium]|nr:tetratricopeptide repeat protein [Candidatus Aminicenantes bacterium]